jgi:hypothetical protein
LEGEIAHEITKSCLETLSPVYGQRKDVCKWLRKISGGSRLSRCAIASLQSSALAEIKIAETVGRGSVLCLRGSLFPHVFITPLATAAPILSGWEAQTRRA